MRKKKRKEYRRSLAVKVNDVALAFGCSVTAVCCILYKPRLSTILMGVSGCAALTLPKDAEASSSSRRYYIEQQFGVAHQSAT